MAPQLYAYSGINLRWAPHVWLRDESSFWPIRGQNVYQAANQKPALGVCWQFSRARPSRQPHHYTPSKVLKLLGRVRRRQLNSVSPQQRAADQGEIEGGRNCFLNLMDMEFLSMHGTSFLSCGAAISFSLSAVTERILCALTKGGMLEIFFSKRKSTVTP